MKIKVLLAVLLLPCMVQMLGAKDSKALLKKDQLLQQSALLSENISNEKRAKALKCCGNNVTTTASCLRGKKGKKGHRGPRGLAGDPGLGELFLNPLMMSWYSEGTYPPSANFDPYFIGTELLAWYLRPADEFTSAIGMNFNIPIDLDRTKPVTAVVHFLVLSDYPIPGDQAQIELNIAYAANDQIIGTVPPATDFSETVFSDDFIIVPAMPLNSSNLRQQSIAIPLDPALMGDQNWAFVNFRRSLPAENEYQGSIYLSTVSIQYSRLP